MTEPTITPIDDRLELAAEELASDPGRLKKRLNDARVVLRRDFKKLFRPGRFVEAEKALYSENGEYKLQWQLREFPEQPESYENQQTSRGTVLLYRQRGQAKRWRATT